MHKKPRSRESTIRFGAPAYINTLPLLYALQKKIIPNDFVFTFAVPTTINKLYAEEKLDVAITSANFALPLTHVPFGISARKKVKSVLLFVRKGIALETLDRIAVPAASAHSRELLRIIAHHFWKIVPSYVLFHTVGEAVKFNAFLLIGDPCLRFSDRDNYTIYDLAEVWAEHTKTPCTFALTVTYEFDPSALLQASLDFSCSHLAYILAEAAERTKLPQKQLLDYFSSLEFVLSENHMQGLKQYEVLAKAT
jgi:predicted solute-binding protein